MSTHSMKTIVAASLIAVAGSAAFAGSNYIKPGEAQNTNSGVTLELVRAETDGVIYAYDNKSGTDGKVLGSAPVKAGVNTDVRVNFTTPALNDVLTVLYTTDTTTPAATAKVRDRNPID
ncbi:hypothetical protein [Celeribacter ethanolicus]|uniref:hypothetical protein n=1 Tax=Celeribacter ethanolicus TaxID=1758178 RepID=UPI0018E0880B|nr:hypothetical protein [Celeribacter ethanolicus]